MPKFRECRDGRFIIKTSYSKAVGNRVRQKWVTLQVSDQAKVILRNLGIHEDGDEVSRDLFCQLIERRLIASMEEIEAMYLGDSAATNLNGRLRELAYPLWKEYAHIYSFDHSPVSNLCTIIERIFEQKVNNPQSESRFNDS